MIQSPFASIAENPQSQWLRDMIAAEVEAVEEILNQNVQSAVGLIQSIGEHTLGAGGKRIRPVFVNLAARAVGNEFSVERSRRLGACMELIHMATLMHDDVIDNAATRRGLPTAATEFGNTAAILSGDVLLAKAMLIMAQDRDARLIETVSESVVSIVEGEVRELEMRGVFDLSEDDHLSILRLKTASLIQGCCEMGATVAGADEVAYEALRTYGLNVGMAFQIVDDLLDYFGDPEKTGKVRATDFREGQATLPLIYLRPHLSDAEATIVRQRFGNNPNDDEVLMLADWIRTRGAFEETEAKARWHVRAALEALEALPASEFREVLSSVAQYVLSREV